MINRETGDVILEVGDRSYTLCMDLNAMCTLEGLFSTPAKEATFPEIVAKVNRRSMTHTRGFIWAALRKHHPDITLEQVTDMVMALGGLDALNRRLAALADSAQADPADLAELEITDRPTAAAPKAPRRTTGAVSISKHAASG
jgi:hypothetical protein